MFSALYSYIPYVFSSPPKKVENVINETIVNTIVEKNENIVEKNENIIKGDVNPIVELKKENIVEYDNTNKVEQFLNEKIGLPSKKRKKILYNKNNNKQNKKFKHDNKRFKNNKRKRSKYNVI